MKTFLASIEVIERVAQHVKDRLGAGNLRVVGDLDRPCQTVGAQVGLLGNNPMT